MNNILKKICDKKRVEIEETKKKCSYNSLKKILTKKFPKRNFKKLLFDSQKNKKNNIIAEIKKASPSAGIIVKDYYPENIAIDYERSGIGAISVLTEKNFFMGNLEHLSLINQKTNLPILRKDFIIDPYQILESKIYKADAVLLIASLLNDNEIKNYISLAQKYDLDCLIETHTEDEIERAIKIGYPIIGINNRNLNDLSVNTNNTLKLVNKVPNNFIIIAESGIKSKNEIIEYNKIGIYNFLIGESILKSNSYSQKIKDLIY